MQGGADRRNEGGGGNRKSPRSSGAARKRSGSTAHCPVCTMYAQVEHPRPNAYMNRAQAAGPGGCIPILAQIPPRAGSVTRGGAPEGSALRFASLRSEPRAGPPPASPAIHPRPRPSSVRSLPPSRSIALFRKTPAPPASRRRCSVCLCPLRLPRPRRLPANPRHPCHVSPPRSSRRVPRRRSPARCAALRPRAPYPCARVPSPHPGDDRAASRRGARRGRHGDRAAQRRGRRALPAGQRAREGLAHPHVRQARQRQGAYAVPPKEEGRVAEWGVSGGVDRTERLDGRKAENAGGEGRGRG